MVYHNLIFSESSRRSLCLENLPMLCAVHVVESLQGGASAGELKAIAVRVASSGAVWMPLHVKMRRLE